MTSAEQAARDLLELIRSPRFRDMPEADRIEALKLAQEMSRRGVRGLYDRMFPRTGPLRRSLYTGAMAFFRAGKEYPERMFIAGNRVGKTETATYEMTAHLTGRYPDWWEGHRWDGPILAMSCAKKFEDLLEVNQPKLLGRVRKARGGNWVVDGGAMLPRDSIMNETLRMRQNPNDVVRSIDIRYRDSRSEFSTLRLKAYAQKRHSFEGKAVHLFHDDEEPPQDVYGEQLLRLMTLGGKMMVTFTPLEGFTHVVQSFIEGHEEFMVPSPDIVAKRTSPVKFAVRVGWENVPHLTERQKEQSWESALEYEKVTRKYGIPAAGVGRIYPLSWDRVSCAPFETPAFWPRGYALDPGWKNTAVTWWALDPNEDVLYCYGEYRVGKLTNPEHAVAIMSRGRWMHGTCDPAASQTSRNDGVSTVQSFRRAGLKLHLAENPVETGLREVLHRLRSGRLKFFRHLTLCRNEYNQYHRRELPDGSLKVVKRNDDLMDTVRYMVMSGVRIMRVEHSGRQAPGRRLMSADRVAGY